MSACPEEQKGGDAGDVEGREGVSLADAQGLWPEVSHQSKLA